MLRIRTQIEQILARHTPHDVDRLRADMDREKIFSAEEAVAYGLADTIIGKRELPHLAAAA
jgi:ATP-dependent Clp protease protease subunit